MKEITHQSDVKKKFKNINGGLIIISIFVLVFIYDVFNSVLGFFDEFIAFISFLIIAANVTLKQKITLYREEIRIAVLLIVLLLIGLTFLVITIGLVILIPSSSNLVFPISIILIGLLSSIWTLKSYSKTIPKANDRMSSSKLIRKL